MKLKKIIHKGQRFELIDISDSTLDLKQMGYVLLNEQDQIVDMTYYRNEKDFKEVIENDLANDINLYQAGDERRYIMIDMLLPFTVCDISILREVNLLMNERYTEEKILLKIFSSNSYNSALKHWKIIPNYLVSVMANRQEWLKIPASFLKTIQSIIEELNFSAGLSGIAFLNGVSNVTICRDAYFSLDAAKSIVYNKLKEAILGGHHSSIESFKIKQILEQTGDLFDFSDMTFNEKEAQKICNNVKRSYYDYYDLNLWEKQFKAYSFSNDYINIMIERAFPKCLISNNRYISTSESKVIMNTINFLKQYCGKTDYSPCVNKLRQYKLAPEFVCAFRDIDSTLIIANLISFSEFNKYAPLLFEYRIARTRVCSLNDARLMFSLLYHIHENRKFVRLAKLILAKLESSNELTAKKKLKLKNELKTIVISHNLRHSDQIVDINNIL